MKILVIDDQEADGVVVGKLLQPMLREVSGQLQCATRLAEGLRIIVEWQPDVTLLDLTLPGESNAEQTIQNIIPRIAPATCVIVLTGKEDDAVIWTKSIDQGAMNYLQKQYYLDTERRRAFWHAIVNAMLLHPHRFKK